MLSIVNIKPEIVYKKLVQKFYIKILNLYYVRRYYYIRFCLKTSLIFHLMVIIWVNKLENLILYIFAYIFSLFLICNL